jgi:hypothetical protein
MLIGPRATMSAPIVAVRISVMIGLMAVDPARLSWWSTSSANEPSVVLHGMPVDFG